MSTGVGSLSLGHMTVCTKEKANLKIRKNESIFKVDWIASSSQLDQLSTGVGFLSIGHMTVYTKEKANLRLRINKSIYKVDWIDSSSQLDCIASSCQLEWVL